MLPAEIAYAQAEAPAAAIEGYVVAVQGSDIILDVAAGRGAAQADLVELWRPVSVRHPVTKLQVRDRFRIGSLQLRQVRDTLSLARAVGELDRDPQPGDIVILRRAAAPSSHPPAKPKPAPDRSKPGSEGDNRALPTEPGAADPRPADKPAARPADQEELEVALLFDQLRGATPEQRSKAYDEWVKARPDSRFAAVLREEAAMLRKIGSAPPREKRDSVLVDAFEPPRRVREGHPVSLALRLIGRTRGVIVHLRKGGETSYSSVVMRRNGPGYWIAVIDGAQVTAGGVEYFIEATLPDGSTSALSGTAATPHQLQVFVPPSPLKLKAPRATVALWSDYADYNRLRGDDVAWQTEGYFGMRFHDVGVRAIRSGFGVYRGVGGSLDELDELGKSARKIGLTYGYLEGEVGFTDFVGLALRGVAGLQDSGVTGGGQLIVRLGNDLKTNIQLGGEFLGGVGLRGFAQLDLRIIDNVPMMFRTEVTNQPAGSAASSDTARPDEPGTPPDQVAVETNAIGARGIVQVGYRFADALEISVRASYQGRTINHSGPGLGGAVSYVW